MGRGRECALCAFCFAVVAACGGDSAPATARWSTVFDSTGDTVVARTAGDIPKDAESRLVLEQRIGAAEGSDSVTFGQIRYVAVTNDGRIFVYDRNGPTIKLFDSSGTLLRFVGRKGGGPGEFEEVAGMDVLPNGQLVLWDASHARINVYSADGDYLRQWRAPISGFFTSNALHTDRSGTIILRLPISNELLALGRESGYVRFDSAGRSRDTVRVPEWIGSAPQLTAWSGKEGQLRVSMTLPMTPTLVHTWSKAGHLLSGPSAPYVVYLTKDSARSVRLEREWTAAAVLPEESTELQERIVWQIRLSVPEWTWNGPGIPASKPAYRAIHSGEDGSIWIALHSTAERILEDESGPRGPESPPPRRYREPNVYDVFGSDGRFWGRVRADANQRILRMRQNHVWGLLTDSLDVPYVARWRVDPPLTP